MASILKWPQSSLDAHLYIICQTEFCLAHYLVVFNRKSGGQLGDGTGGSTCCTLYYIIKMDIIHTSLHIYYDNNYALHHMHQTQIHYIICIWIPPTTLPEEVWQPQVQRVYCRKVFNCELRVFLVVAINSINVRVYYIMVWGQPLQLLDSQFSLTF